MLPISSRPPGRPWWRWAVRRWSSYDAAGHGLESAGRDVAIGLAALPVVCSDFLAPQLLGPHVVYLAHRLRLVTRDVRTPDDDLERLTRLLGGDFNLLSTQRYTGGVAPRRSSGFSTRPSLKVRDAVAGEDRRNGALRQACTAIDALVGVDIPLRRRAAVAPRLGKNSSGAYSRHKASFIHRGLSDSQRFAKTTSKSTAAGR
ncbi:MAG: hypothetical protein JWL70_1529 [Acidimicrobiia bacterium]|nr:hypothetical protein [Acidimicrobiia bacterium]